MRKKTKFRGGKKACRQDSVFSLETQTLKCGFNKSPQEYETPAALYFLQRWKPRGNRPQLKQQVAIWFQPKEEFSGWVPRHHGRRSLPPYPRVQKACSSYGASIWSCLWKAHIQACLLHITFISLLIFAATLWGTCYYYSHFRSH